MRVHRYFESYLEDLEPLYRSAYHVLKVENITYAVAPSLINTENNTGYFCQKCLKVKCPHTHSRFLEFDYGISYVSKVSILYHNNFEYSNIIFL